jgi:GNAT superfamily N-acetyltransferase
VTGHESGSSTAGYFVVRIWRTTVTTPSDAASESIVTLTELDAERAMAVLTLAFSSDPASRWTWPEPHRYLATFPDFARAFGGAAFAHGTAYGVGSLAGVALWLPPDVHPDQEALTSLIESTVDQGLLGRIFATFEQMSAYHPTEPHWYLPLIGIDPVQQGRGYGSRLLAHGLAQCDRDGALAYLESTNPANIPLYERHGFEVLGAVQSAGSPPIVPMLRRAR